PLDAQIPTNPQEAMRLLQQDPEAVRQRILASGLSASEIRARLSAAGLPPGALDAFLGGAPLAGQPAGFDTSTLAALSALGVTVQTPDGLELVPLSSGLRMGAPPAAPAGGPRIFGIDVFRRATSQFQPLLYGPVSEDYRLGPGDSMVLVLTGEVELARELLVTREGFVVIPDVGQLSVANLTMSDFRALLRRRLARVYSGIDRGSTTFDVTITQLRTIQAYVSGEVTQAGAYQLSSVATVMNALYAAGGPTNLGNLRDIRLRRRSGEELRLDLYPYLLSGEVASDVRLEQGDVVFVPLRGRRVQVAGSVQRPAIYELAEADDLLDVLASAGGFAPEANRERITIHRVARPSDRGPGLSDRVAVDLGLRPSSDPTAAGHLGGVVVPPVGLQDGDSIVVDAVPALSDAYYVTIAGMVQTPGIFPWQEGMTLRELLLLARGPTVGADLREAEVSRLPDDRVSGELADRLRVPLDSSYLSRRDAAGRFEGPPGLAFPPAGSSPELVLEPFDQVVILRQPDFEMPQSVRITGEVPVPGQYTLLTKDDRVSDLVTRANGLLPTAYPEGARLFRDREGLGRIDLDLPSALSGAGGDEDLVLQPGDSLHVPMYSPTVVVQGAVNSPVTVLYREGEDLDYYIENAGGFRRDADQGRLSVRYANGQARTRSKVLLWSSYPVPGPGSVVSVPAKDPQDRLDTRGLIADLVAILGSVTTVIVVLTR
ncbi:MAG TPA: SLBB domain-containing protein, partial [Longimicrobiales bacterium]|nr:SLBB domain-containing protein [Longimicrobiales bacterium]